ncbi:helix-turn-helix domain-containing protein, partial [Escherichia coli]|uniref:helix-turn-helix domain-containing protein n=1 Tax=Escherichia coli TaxID=562 RepID=UPI0021096A50
MLLCRSAVHPGYQQDPDYLKTAIKQQGCTLQQVADASGMTKGYLSQLLNAKIKSPSAQKMEALHRFLGLEFP